MNNLKTLELLVLLLLLLHYNEFEIDEQFDFYRMEVSCIPLEIGREKTIILTYLILSKNPRVFFTRFLYQAPAIWNLAVRWPIREDSTEPAIYPLKSIIVGIERWFLIQKTKEETDEMRARNRPQWIIRYTDILSFISQ